MLFLLIIVIFVGVIWNNSGVNKQGETDKFKDKWAYLSESEKQTIKSKSRKWYLLSFLFPLISCIYFKRWTLFILCIIEFCLMDFTIHFVFEVNYPIVYCIVIRIMVLYNFMGVNYNAGYFREQIDKNVQKKQRIKVNSKNFNKILITLLFFFVSIIVSGCNINNIGLNQDSFKCYTKSGTLNNNPKLDENGNIVNCYDESGESNGRWIFYHENGQIKAVVNYKNGVEDGKRTYYYENGQIEMQLNFMNGEKFGEQVHYGENGRISKYYFKDGKQDGEQITYDESGQIIIKKIYVDGEEKHHIMYYYDSGRIRLEKRWNTGENNSKEIYYYENGQTEMELNLVNGELDGKQISYYENGQIKMDGTFINGKQDGQQIHYYENGQISGVENFVNGELDGKQICYYENGQIKYEGYYKNDKEDGERTFYFENGKVDTKATFKNGNRIK